MFVIKRSGQKVPIRYDSITDRNIELAKGLNINVDVLSKNVIVSLKDCMTTGFERGRREERKRVEYEGTKKENRVQCVI